MKRAIITALAVLFAWGMGVNFASAQFGTLGQAPIRPRPTVSPYVDLGVGGAMSYYGLIQPQINASRSIQDLQGAVTRLNPDGTLVGPLDLLNPQSVSSALTTGHTATYFNYSHYYPQGTPGASTNTQPGLGLGNGMGGYNPALMGGGVGGYGIGGRGTFFGPALGIGFGSFGR